MDTQGLVGAVKDEKEQEQRDLCKPIGSALESSLMKD